MSITFHALEVKVVPPFWVRVDETLVLPSGMVPADGQVPSLFSCTRERGSDPVNTLGEMSRQSHQRDRCIHPNQPVYSTNTPVPHMRGW
jgi:hypothetical protein